jgi:hypothetical protein
MRYLLCLLALLISFSANASRGGVDADGCHKPKRQARHCHPERAGGAGSGGAYAGSAETQRGRDRRLMRECRGAVNAGVCQGYTR